MQKFSFADELDNDFDDDDDDDDDEVVVKKVDSSFEENLLLLAVVPKFERVIKTTATSKKNHS